METNDDPPPTITGAGLNHGPQVHPHPGEHIYSSFSPEDAGKTYGRACGLSLYWNQDRAIWTLIFRYRKGHSFGTSREIDVDEPLEVLNLSSGCEAALEYDMLRHFELDYVGRGHCAMMETAMGIRSRLVAAWTNEVARFCQAAVDNHWEWRRSGKWPEPPEDIDNCDSE
jgi:hypothetical protein